MDGNKPRKSEGPCCVACGEKVVVNIPCPHCNLPNSYLYATLADATTLRCGECGGELAGSWGCQKALAERDAQAKKRIKAQVLQTGAILYGFADKRRRAVMDFGEERDILRKCAEKAAERFLGGAPVDSAGLQAISDTVRTMAYTQEMERRERQALYGRQESEA